MEQNDSYKVTSVSQETPSILWNPEVHYSVQNSPLPIPNLNQTNPINTSKPRDPKTHSTILPSYDALTDTESGCLHVI